MIDYIKGTNFLPYRELSCVFPSKGLVHIDGFVEDETWATSNGSGKSSILSFIKWVWFGITDRGGVNSVINAKAGKNCYGEIGATIDGKSVVVQRYRKHKEHDNGVFLWINGEQIVADELQPYIDSALGFDADVFLRAFVFDNKLAVAKMKDTDAKDFFEKLLGADFSEWYDLSKTFSSKMQEEANKVLSEITSKKNLLSSHEAALTEAKTARDQWEAQRNEALKALQERLGVVRVQLEAEQAKLTAAVAQDEQHRAQREAWTKEITNLNSRLTSIDNPDNLRRHAITCRQIADSAIPQSQLECPTCHRPWSEEQRQKAQKDHEQKVKLNQLESEELERKATEAEQRIQSCKEFIKYYQKHLDSLPVANIAGPQTAIASLRSEETLLAQQIQQQQNSTNNWDHRVNQITAEMQKINSEIEQLEMNSRQWGDYLKAIDFVTEMFSKTGLKSYMLDIIVPYINSRLAYYLKILTNGDIEAKILTTTKTGREKFHLSVKKQDGGDTYDSLSDGQASRLNVCLILALHDNIKTQIPTKILVFDELFDRMDSVGIERAAEILRELGQQTLVLVITHNPHLSQYANDIITVRMKNNEARIG